MKGELVHQVGPRCKVGNVRQKKAANDHKSIRCLDNVLHFGARPPMRHDGVARSQHKGGKGRHEGQKHGKGPPILKKQLGDLISSFGPSKGSNGLSGTLEFSCGGGSGLQ